MVPKDDLSGFEAYEYSVLKINEMRTQCSGFHLAPLQIQNYRPEEVYVRRHDLYSEYRLRLEPLHGLAPSAIHVNLAREHSVTDLSLFEMTGVRPQPCDLFSAADDAELMVSWNDEHATRAQDAAMKIINEQRKILCPQRPPLQLQRLVTAAQQPVEGIVIRLILEMREASASFQAASFTDVVLVNYVLDEDVPGQSTISPEVYPARGPCDMQYTQEQQTELGTGKKSDEASDDGSSSTSASSGMTNVRRLRATARRARRGLGRNASSPRRLVSLADAAPTGSLVNRRFVDQGLDIPDDFDPRLARTLCFPHGFSRRQGSCGASFAFTATAVAAFRECLWKLKQGVDVPELRFFSAQELISCDGQGDGCAGGSAGSAFYYMKQEGIARETCSPYRMRCFSDQSGISAGSADDQTSTPKSRSFKSSTAACPVNPNPKEAPCKCLPDVFHFTTPVRCDLLPNACPKTKLPHYFKIMGTAEGSTIPLFERHVMQELLLAGPLDVSILLFDDFYDPISWTESGIYVHKKGSLVGRHAVVAVGWGTDADSRDYWLLLNSFGRGWQQEGYFKILRGDTPLRMAKFGAWGADWSEPTKDRSKPTIADVEVAFSPVAQADANMATADTLVEVWLVVSAITDEAARLLVRVQGLKSTVTGQDKDTDFKLQHVFKLDLLKLGLSGDRAKIQLWAVDKAQNTAEWGPFTLDIPSKETFRLSQSRRLARLEELSDADRASANSSAPAEFSWV